MGFLLELAFDIVFEIVVSVAGALWPRWGNSDSRLLRLIAYLILGAVIAGIAFVVYWFFIR